MNKFFFILTSLFFFCSVSAVFSQPAGLTEISEELRQPVLFGEIIENWPPVVGQQFLPSEWAEGSVQYSSGELAQGHYLKYDGLNDQLIWFNQRANRQVILVKPLIAGFSLKDPFTGTLRHFERLDVRLTSRAGNQGMFLEVLSEGRYDLLVLRQMEQSGVRERRHGRGMVEIPEIEARPVYVIRHHDNSINQFRRPRRAVIQDLLPGGRSELRQILSGYRIRWNEEADFVRAFEMVNAYLTGE